MAFIYISTLSIGLIFAGGEATASGKCTGTKLAAAQRKVEAVLLNAAKVESVWKHYRDAFTENRECMAVNEALTFGEASRKLLKSHWASVSKLGKYKKEDTAYYAYVLSALTDETSDQDDVRDIRALAQTKCPKDAKDLCNEIKGQAGKK